MSPSSLELAECALALDCDCLRLLLDALAPLHNGLARFALATKMTRSLAPRSQAVTRRR